MKIKDLKELIIGAVQKYVSHEEAEYFANEVIETDIRKPPRKGYSHGIVDDIKTWKDSKNRKISRVVDLPGYVQYNFNGLGPSLKIKDIHDTLESRASKNGIAMVSVINSAGMHTMHLWTQGLAKRGLFAIAGFNGGPEAVVPLNGTKGLLGTNPLTYAFPGDMGDIVIDMATSEIPFFKIVDANKNNRPLPLNTAVDNDGELTTDPHKAIDEKEVSNLLPMGGNYKGYNINYLMEVMTSALIGAKISSQMNSFVAEEHGGFIIAVAIDKVTSRKDYDVAVKSMNEKIRSQKPKDGVERVVVPGDHNLERKKGMNDNIEISINEEYTKILKDLGK